MITAYQAKVNAVFGCIETTVNCAIYADRDEALAATSETLRNRAGEMQIDSAQLADGIRLAVQGGIITAAEAKLL